ncbi:MAG: nicotinate (nicotinamide) nucleotide adenylyltransferase [Candidatus Omnitrophica bacterium]|nr:nicotinate (nicotinamide) nucleotide adenylyltransferase [Candidatus Omnitrophota bacterium]
MKVGVFGGTFNPIHLGHLVLAETARDALSLERVVFIPTRQPPHKPAAGLLAGSVRLTLVQLAIRHHPAFVASDIELQRDGPSYTVDTVQLLHNQVPDAKLFLLVGEDMLAVRWRAWSDLKRLCTIVVAHRPGAKPRRTERGVCRVAMPQLDIASADIRSRAAAGRSIRYLVPDAVARYIHQHHLYQKEGRR